MKIFIAGGTGFLGRPLVELLKSQGHTLVVASRTPRAQQTGVSYVIWNGKDLGHWAKEIDGSDAVINLAGEGIFEKRWTEEFKRRLLDSRLEATGILVEAIKQAKTRPKVFISASAVGFYGDTQDKIVDETSGPGADYLAEITIKWEEEARRAAGFGVRVTHPRIGIVLGKNGGALKPMLPAFKAFLGGPVGSGHQWFPWVHISDALKAICLPLENEKLEGPYNLCAPGIVQMDEFCKTLAGHLHRPAWFRMPGVMLKVLVGEAAEALLTGQRVSCKKLAELDFQFTFKDLDSALDAIL